MNALLAFLLWCLLFAVSWPLALLALVLWPLVWLLFRIDRAPERFEESTLIVGLSAAAVKP